MEGKFPCAACREGVFINSILCQFCRFCVRKRYSGARGKLKEDSKFKCHTCANSKQTYSKGLSRHRIEWSLS